ncbi:hypothetical protein DFJ74DRAFT_692931 [Hyaloraphidium curvatum]|nr:hypothetical protein DFJ74DRAFT_692931 [Hyaloraphidium curvatum]
MPSALLGYTPFSYAAVPAFWLLAQLPHFAALGVKIAGNAWNNYNPRHDEAEQAKLSAEQKALAQRLDGASANGLESLGFFAGAVALSAVAKVDQDAVNYDCYRVLMTRLLYTLAYAGAASQGPSLARSGLWIISSGYIVRMYLRLLTKA